MKLNCWCPLEANDKRLSTGLLIVRLVFGIAMAIHGWPKFQNLTSWMGPGAPVPVVLIALAAIAEFLGGILIALGALTSVASFLMMCTMLVAASFHISKGDPWISQGGAAWELAGLYLALSILFLLVGPGRFSLDAVLLKKFRA
ncbi:MAG: DoxX family protein [Bacteriovoracaceae bacterium]